MERMHFYAVIIGTEILNGRRTDKHFEFLREALAERGHTLHASLVVTDESPLIASVFELVRNDPAGVLFSFGGIGSTPDDLTRDVAAQVFTGRGTVRHAAFEKAVIERFGDASYPHRVRMADLPEGAELLHNPVNNMSGFSLASRYFFMPGFPEMSHPMALEALARYIPDAALRHRMTLHADTSENSLIHVMQTLPPDVELSSLPMFVDGRPRVDISLSSEDAETTERWFRAFTDELDRLGIAYTSL